MKILYDFLLDAICWQKEPTPKRKESISWLTEFYAVLSVGDSKDLNCSTWPCTNVKNNLQILKIAFEDL